MVNLFRDYGITAQEILTSMLDAIDYIEQTADQDDTDIAGRLTESASALRALFGLEDRT